MPHVNTSSVSEKKKQWLDLISKPCLWDEAQSYDVC